jgi:hypothetical protein
MSRPGILQRLAIQSISDKFAGKVNTRQVQSAHVLLEWSYFVLHLAYRLYSLVWDLADSVPATAGLRGRHCGADHLQELLSATLVVSI